MNLQKRQNHTTSFHYLGWTARVPDAYKQRGCAVPTMESTWRNRGCRPDSNGLTRQAALTEEIAWSQNCDDSFPADLVDHGELYTTLLNVHNGLGGVASRRSFSLSETQQLF